jgi:hypothetical protein
VCAFAFALGDERVVDALLMFEPVDGGADFGGFPADDFHELRFGVLPRFVDERVEYRFLRVGLVGRRDVGAIDQVMSPSNSPASMLNVPTSRSRSHDVPPHWREPTSRRSRDRPLRTSGSLRCETSHHESAHSALPAIVIRFRPLPEPVWL